MTANKPNAGKPRNQKAAAPQPSEPKVVPFLGGNVPYSQEAEEAVIGSVLMNPEAFVVISTFLNAEDFYILRHNYIWSALRTLYDRGDDIDYLTIQEELRTAGHLNDVGGSGALTMLINSMPSSMHVEAYARIVESAAIRRRLMATADEIKTLALREDVVIKQVTDDAERLLLEVTSPMTSKGVISLRDGLSKYWNQIQLNKELHTDDILGVPTGLKALDSVIGGLRRGKVYLSVGVSGHGKTDTTLNILLNAAQLGARVLFFSLDMAYDGIVNKLLAIATGIPHAKIESGRLTKQEWERYAKAQAVLERLSLWIYEKTKGVDREPWDRIVSTSDLIARRHGLDLIAIDYTMLVSSGGRYRGGEYNDKVYGVMNLPVLAQKFNVPVLGLHQMNKRRITSEAYRPDDMEYLEYGGENAADAIFAWYKKSRVAGYEHTDRRKLEAIILKNRFGPDNITLRFDHDGPTARVTDWKKPPSKEELQEARKAEFERHYLDELDDRAYGDTDDE